MTFRKILNRNLILMMLPIFLLFGASRLILGQTLLLQRYTADRIEEKEGKKVSAEVLYLAGKKNAEVLLANLKYTGFDEVLEDGTVVGKYYMKEEEGVVVFYILKTTTASLYEEVQKSDGVVYRCFGIVENPDAANAIIKAYGTSLEVGDLEGLASAYIFDELSYPEREIFLIKAARNIFLLILVILGIYTLLALLFPVMNFETWPLKKQYGDIGQIVRKLNREMKKRYVGKKGNEIITQNFHIFVQVSSINVYTNEEYENLSK